jgi:hypothetical protein
MGWSCYPLTDSRGPTYIMCPMRISSFPQSVLYHSTEGYTLVCTRAIKFGGQHMEHPFDMSLRAYPQSEGKDWDLEKQ